MTRRTIDLSITIPSVVVWVLLISLAWWAAAYWGFGRILQWRLHRYLRQHKTGTVPDRYMFVAYLIAGPVGWLAWGFDEILQRTKRR